MIIIKYFYVYFLIVVLDFSAPLSADEHQQNITAPAAVNKKLQAPNATVVPFNAEFPKNCTTVVNANETLTSLNPNITLINSNNTTQSECGTKLDNTSNTNATSENQNKEANKTTTDESLSETLNVSNLNKTENVTSNDHLSNVLLPPKVLPLDGVKYISYNVSIIKSSLNITETKKENHPDIDEKNSTNPDKIDTEVSELLNVHKQPNNDSDITASKPDISQDKPQVINDETELIDDGQNTEDDLRKHNSNKKISPGVPLIQGQLAAILAAVFVIISVITYVGLLSWRRFLERRYGNRELLVNEDEFNDRDMRHFTI